MKYKKSELTAFSKNCAYGADQLLNGFLVATDIAYSQIGTNIKQNNDPYLLLEVSKRYVKYVKNEIGFDMDNGEVQDFQNIIEAIVTCCEENNWFQ